MVKIYEELEQGTEEWFAVRRGKMTASHASAIGNDGSGVNTYAIEKAGYKTKKGVFKLFKKKKGKKSKK